MKKIFLLLVTLLGCDEVYYIPYTFIMDSGQESQELKCGEVQTPFGDICVGCEKGAIMHEAICTKVGGDGFVCPIWFDLSAVETNYQSCNNIDCFSDDYCDWCCITGL